MNIEFLSPSQIELYLTCPRAYMYRYKEKIEAKPSVDICIGRTVHYYIEKKILNQSPDTSVETFFEGIQEEEANAGIATAKKIIDFINNDNSWLPQEPIEKIEAGINFYLDNIPIYIIPDIITKERIIDHKVISKRSIFRYEKKYPMQLILAAIGTQKDKGTYNLFIKDDASLVYTKRDINNLLIKSDRIKEIVNFVYSNIKRDLFPPVDIDSDKGWKCSERFCDYFDLCKFGKAQKDSETTVYF